MTTRNKTQSQEKTSPDFFIAPRDLPQKNRVRRSFLLTLSYYFVLALYDSYSDNAFSCSELLNERLGRNIIKIEKCYGVISS